MYQITADFEIGAHTFHECGFNYEELFPIISIYWFPSLSSSVCSNCKQNRPFQSIANESKDMKDWPTHTTNTITSNL